MKPLDWFFLALSLALTVGTAWAVFSPTDAPMRVEVQDAKGLQIYPLDESREIAAEGPLGTTHVHIEGHQVWVEDSPCTNKVCIAMGRIHASGQYVACLPNRIFVKITGGGAAAQEATDAGVY